MHDAHPNAIEGACVEIKLVTDPTVSLCLQQNSIPLVKQITLVNRGKVALEDLTIRMWAEPAYAYPLSFRLATLQAAEPRRLDGVELQLSPEFLTAQTESVRGLLHVTVEAAGKTLGTLVQSVDVLSYDHWAGSRSPIELVAAFVMPNHPVVESVLSRAQDLLRASERPDAMDGYQRGSRNAAQLMAGAIYEAVRREALGYIMPPASFEETGQKIRTPERVFQNRLGTCLDLCLLLAACLEQAGLHPLIVFMKGHAFVAVWLEERMLAAASDDDPIDLRKRIDAGEMLGIESTMLTGTPSHPVDRAAREARRQLDDIDKFVCVVDVARARQAMIRPMHGRLNESGVFQPLVSAGVRTVETGRLPEMLAAREAPTIKDTSPPGETRLDRWRRKLLDLTLRNRLLNFRPTAKTLPVLCPDVGRFEDLLANGVQFQLLGRPQEFSQHDPRDRVRHMRDTGEDGLVAVLREALTAKRIHVDLEQAELEQRALGMYREARLAQEESGTSALYCALGFLAWYKSDESEKAMRAPLLLLPVNLARSSVNRGFTLEVADDEPRVNMSLLELLQQEFELEIGGVDPLPTDDHGIDVQRVFDVFRAAISGIKRWEVVPDVQIGFFSFTKFLMWRDLQEHASDLLQNDIVHHLVQNRSGSFDPGGPIPKPEELDRERRPDTTFCPLSADSSQLAAVFAAADGRSFVLEGPPGTGKSQTIANMIAQCLAVGRSVLFVAEKNVALNVVYERLAAAGLGDYCLELHSNKAKKADVMRQLERAMMRTPALEPAEWARTGQRIDLVRTSLNGYVSALHQPRETGESVFHALAHLAGNSSVALERLDFGTLGDVDEARLEALRELAQRLRATGSDVFPVRAHPWRFVTRGAWSPAWQVQVETHLKGVLEAIEAVMASADSASRALGLARVPVAHAQLSALAAACRALAAAPYVPEALLVERDWKYLEETIRAVLPVGRRRDALRLEVRKTFVDAITQADIAGALSILKKVAAAWAPWRWLRRFLVWRSLRPLLLPSVRVPLAELEGGVEQAMALKLAENELASSIAPVSSALGRLYVSGDGRWDDVERAVDWARRARIAAAALAGDDPREAVALRQHWAALLAGLPESLAASGSAGRALSVFESAMSTLEARTSTFEAEIGMARGGLLLAYDALDLRRMAEQVRELIRALPRLRSWCLWTEVREAAARHGLAPILDAFVQERISAADIPAVFERAFYQWFVEYALNQDPVLRTFHAKNHERVIEQFCQADAAHQELSRQVIRARRDLDTPTTGVAAAKNSALGVLRRETQKKKRHMALRALLGETGDVVMRLTPCFLMSPISVAQYLDPRMPKFDIVIFDEASQIPAWEAVGAIARGRTAVIVGDPKQLPPTNFFGRTEAEDAGDGAHELEDLESILDDCIGAGLPWLRLRWHYRSRHESLIAFSNHHYYDNKLLTLPSADTQVAKERGVSFRYVANGLYDKGKSRTNRPEAEAVVAEVVRRLTAPGRPGSIGIVTFNTQQCTLIQNLLDAACREHPQIEPFFAEGRADSVFVKNLENVQGDERDIIFFSLGYGPDAEGRVGMNFGPMNRDGGQRRLNVAITRARCEVVVFSSLRADQLDLTRTRARGVRDLRSFLDYAERGVRALRETSAETGRDFESPFEEAVCMRLRALGWEVIPQVGCSGYRIDLGVVDPDARGRFLMGVECDGAAYHSAASARDRDKLRAAVLGGLGWKLWRIWSTDFWQDADHEMKRLHEALEQELASARLRRNSAPAQDVATPADGAKSSPMPPADPPKVSQAARARRPAAKPRSSGIPYVVTPLRRLGSPETFYEPGSKPEVARAVQLTVEQEGPVSFALLSSRVTAAWSFSRVTAQAKDLIASLIADGVLRENDGDAVFLWPEGVVPHTYDTFRVHTSPQHQRDAIDLPLIEVRNAARHVLREAGGTPSEDLAREVARIFGFERLGTRVAQRMNAGVKLLFESGWAVERAGRVIVVK